MSECGDGDDWTSPLLLPQNVRVLIMCLAFFCSATCAHRERGLEGDGDGAVAVVHTDRAGLGYLKDVRWHQTRCDAVWMLALQRRSDATDYWSVGSISWGVFDVLGFVEIPLGCSRVQRRRRCT